MKSSALCLLLISLVAGNAVADPNAKPPPCEPSAKGALWNFGTEAKPDVRRCDGVSYVLVATPSAADPGIGAAECKSQAAEMKRMCESICELTRVTCELSIDSTRTAPPRPTRETCNREKSRCSVKC